MAIEVERKFIINGCSPILERHLRSVNTSRTLEQGYLCSDDDTSTIVRVRIDGAVGVLCVKTRRDEKSCFEYEVTIPLSEAVELLKRCKYKLRKRRYVINLQNILFDIDVYLDDLNGLVTAEYEFNEDSPPEFIIPLWFEKEVTSNPEYSNFNLAKSAYILEPRLIAK